MRKQTVLADHSAYNSMPLIDDVEPVGERDMECLRELRDVLRKHGKLDRFGVGLLHKHFPLAAGEVMIEETDVEARSQTIRPYVQGDVDDASMITTLFSLNEGEQLIGCSVQCVKSHDGGGHYSGHVRY